MVGDNKFFLVQTVERWKTTSWERIDWFLYERNTGIKTHTHTHTHKSPLRNVLFYVYQS